MGNLTKVKYTARMIAKEEDFTYGETVEILNTSLILEQLINSTNHCIISGGSVVERGTPSMNVDVEAILGFNKTSDKMLFAGSTLGPISVTNGEASNRIDILEIRELETDYDSKTRAFKDPATGTVSYQAVATKTRYEIEAQVTVGVAGSGNAPTVTAGWVKLAEIAVDAGESTAIYDADITNCGATKDGEANPGWTTDTTHIFRLKGMSELKDMFRVAHNEDGSHVTDSITADDIDFGDGADEVDADILPLGTIVNSVPTGGTTTNLAATSFTRAALQEILNRLINLSGVENGAIDLRHMSVNSIDSDQYVDGSIDKIHLAADIVDGTKIANDAISNEHMSVNSIDSDQYVDGSIDKIHLSSSVLQMQYDYVIQTAVEFAAVFDGTALEDVSIYLKNNGTPYLLNNEIELKSNVIIHGDGRAIINRNGQYRFHTTHKAQTAISSWATDTFTVTSSASFVVGDTVHTTEDNTFYQIIAIPTGTTIQVDKTISGSSSVETLSSCVVNIKTKNWIFDGQGGVNGLPGSTTFTGDGGAFYIPYCVKSIFEAKVRNCDVSGNGGAYQSVYGMSYGHTIKHVNNCSANGGGGVSNCAHSIISHISHCTSNGSGGGVVSCWHSIISYVSNCESLNNVGGGVASCQYSTISYISYCTATNGGGVSDSNYSTITNITYCKATQYSGGGAHQCDYSIISNVAYCLGEDYGGGVSYCDYSYFSGWWHNNAAPTNDNIKECIGCWGLAHNLSTNYLEVKTRSTINWNTTSVIL